MGDFANKKGELLRSKNFMIYYGVGCEDELSRYDLTIVEPSARDRESVRKIRSSGTLVFAYLSVMEIHSTAKEFALLDKQDFVTVGDHLLMNNTYGTYIVSLESERWKRILLHKAGCLFHQHEYDGIFLDTVGNAEYREVLEAQGDLQVLAIAAFISELRTMLPECMLIQNNGLRKIYRYTAEWIDAVCWENPAIHTETELMYTAHVIERLETLKRTYPVQVLLVEETDPFSSGNTRLDHGRAVYDLACEKSFLYYGAPVGYGGMGS